MAKKIRTSISIDPALLQRARNTVAALAAPPEQLTLTSLMERGLRAELTRLEQVHNHGAHFPSHLGQIRTGRPLGMTSDEDDA